MSTARRFMGEIAHIIFTELAYQPFVCPLRYVAPLQGGEDVR